MTKIFAIIFFVHLAIVDTTEHISTQMTPSLMEETMAVAPSDRPFALPRVSLQVLDERGIVSQHVTTNQTIRLRIQGYAYMEHIKQPLVNQCWYTDVSTNDSNESNTKSELFVDKGCAVPNSLIKKLDVPFFQNGDYDVISPTFDRMSLRGQAKLDRMVFTCQILFCSANQTCQIQCPSQWSHSYNVDKSAYALNASTTVYIDVTGRRESDTKTVMLASSPGIDEQVVRHELPRPIPGNRTFLKKNLEYFVLATLIMTTLLLLCCAYAGYNYFAKKNNKEMAEKQDSDENEILNESHIYVPTKCLTSCHYDKIAYVHGADGAYELVSSPPPEYGHSGIWATPQKTKHRHSSDASAHRLTSNTEHTLEQSPRRHLTVSSPVGGELYPERTRIPKIMQLDETRIQCSPIKSRDNEIAKALHEYFERQDKS